MYCIAKTYLHVKIYKEDKSWRESKWKNLFHPHIIPYIFYESYLLGVKEDQQVWNSGDSFVMAYRLYTYGRSNT